MRRTLSAILAGALLLGSCSNPSSEQRVPFTRPDQRTTATTTSPTAGPSTSDPTTGATTTTSTGGEVIDGAQGSAGLGDPYFPELGNSGYDVTHYAIDLFVEPELNIIDGAVAIDAVATTDLASFNLDFIEQLPIESVLVDGQAAAHRLDGEELVITPATALEAGEEFVVQVEYSGTPPERFLANESLQMGWQQTAEGTFVVAEPDSAHTWFPSNDHPADKATFTFRIQVPEPFTAVANGVLIGSAPSLGETTTFVWEMRQPMATYLATVVVAELVRIDRGTVDGVILRDYLPPTSSDPPPFQKTAEVLEYLISIFGPYPFEAYGQVMVPDWPAALETQTISVFGTPAISESIVVHEAAHQWFGDSVSPATWQDVWLNEGFATYAEWLWFEHTGGHIDDVAENTRRFLGSADHRPIGDPGVDELFGGAVYQRGALTLHALRREVGDEVFFEILRTWASRFEGQSVSTADFIALAEELSGKDLSTLFEGWLFRSDLPDIPPG